MPDLAHLQLNFSNINTFFSTATESQVKSLFDNLYDIAKKSHSSESKDMFKLIASHSKSNYLVDTCVNIIKDKDASYIASHAMEALVIIGTNYAARKAVECGARGMSINNLYNKTIECEDVFDFVVDTLVNTNRFNVEDNVLIEGFNRVLHLKNCREKIRVLYNMVIAPPQNENRGFPYHYVFPTDNLPGIILSLYDGTHYLQEPEVKTMFAIASNHTCKRFQNHALRILDGSNSVAPTVKNLVEQNILTTSLC